MKKLLLLGFLLFLFSNFFAQNNKDQTVTVVTARYFDVSKPLTEMKPIKGFIHKENKEVENYFKEPIGAENDFKDPARQYFNGAKVSANILTNFDGANNGDNASGVAPPDTQGDVSPNYYVQAVNNVTEIFNKSGVSVYGPVNTSVFWDGFNGSWTGTNDGDPIVLYDEQADRWLISQFAVNTSDNTQWELIAISTTNNPTGTYYRYAFQFTDMPDYPKLGIWPDGYYMSANRFTVSGGNFNGTYACAFERSQMLVGNSGARMILISNSSSADPYSMLPSDCDGNFPSVGTPNYFVFDTDDNMYGSADLLKIWAFTANWTTPASSTFVEVASLSPTTFNTDFTSNIAQPGSTSKLDVLNDRMMFRAQFRQFSGYKTIVVSRTVNVGSNVAGIRWYELRNTGTSWSIYQQSTYSPDNTNRWMPSIAMNANGDIAIGYSVSSSSIYPSIRVAGRYASDPLNQMTVSETSVLVGTASQSGVTRWGDYSMMSIDPSDDDFWFTTEYTSGSWNWKTRIAEFDFPSPCTPPSTQASTFSSSNIGDNQMTVSWTRGNGDGVIVVAKKSSAVDSDPSSGNTYTANSIFGSGNQLGTENYVVYVGTGENVTVTGLTPGTTYYYAVYEYFSANNCYNLTKLTGNATTTGTAPCTPCASNGNTSFQTSTTRVIFNTIDNTSAKPSGYSDYTNISTTVLLGNSYNLSAYVNTDGSYTVQTKVWIDWNHNCLFTDAGEEYNLGSATNVTNGITSASPYSVTVPNTAYIGSVRMRVSTKYSTAATSCQTAFDGEVEDYTVIVTSNTPTASVSSTPGCSTGSVTVSSNLTGTQTFYLRDNSGGAISDWTGDATSHEFTGLSNGSYKGQVQKDGNMSTLSNATTLTNLTNPLDPTSVSASDTAICSGSNSILSYTGGSGSTFKWYTASCGGAYLGSGNNLTVTPTSTTTYYGRWENTCGNSTCKTITVNVDDIIQANAGIDDQTCDSVYNMSANVPTPGTGEWTVQSGSANIVNSSLYNTEIHINISPVTLRWTITNGECADYDDVDITMYNGVELLSQPLSQTKCVNDNVSFTVGATGLNLSYQWQKNSVDITDENSETLTISNLTLDDNGLYRCVINSTCGSDTTEVANLTVNESTEIITQPVSVTNAELGDTIVFTVTANGSNLEYQWYKNTNIISGEINDTYTIFGVTIDDEGDYYVSVSGDCGLVNSDNVYLTVIANLNTINEFGVNVFPNPSNGRFNIEFEKLETSKEIKIYDENGRIIYYGNFDKKFNQIELGNVSSGVYYMQIYDNQTKNVLKLIIK